MTREAPLETILKRMIAAEGPIRLDRYMSLCLSHPVHGYYNSGDPFGATGDFTTAPEISQVFGELIGVWCVHVWQTMASPIPLRLIELGPGRGTLMADLLRVASRLTGLDRNTIAVDLVETSPTLRQIQATRLDGHHVAWHENLHNVPLGPAIVVANEFFDALPVRQYVFRNGRWAECFVGLNERAQLAFGFAPAPPPPPAALPHERPPEGTIVECSEAQMAMAEAIGRRLAAEGGAALIIDYGHEGGYGDTLQALRQHRFVSPLDQPGRSDLTAHVNFAILRQALQRAGACTYGPISQAGYLKAMGLTERAERLKSSADAKQRSTIDSAIRRLAGHETPMDMGTLFKVLAACHPTLPIPHPFQ